MRPAALVLSMLALAPTLSAGTTAAPSRIVPPNARDFSHVTTIAAAKALARRGELVEILLFPAELGGADAPENRAYVPPEAAAAREPIVGTLIRFRAQGLIDRMTVTPAYKGASIVPSRIAMHATARGKKGSFGPVIEVW